MVTTSIKNLTELNHPAIQWISRDPTFEPYQTAAEVMGYLHAVRLSGLVAVGSALGQTLIGALVAYAFARIHFAGREILFGLLLFTVIVPLQTIMVPQFMLYSKLDWTNKLYPLVVPGLFGYGVRGGILLIVYRQFFRGLPYELEDAAYVDGAGTFRTFWQIMFPLAKPAILVVFLFSLVWTWNDAFIPNLVISTRDLMTVTQRLQIFNLLLNDPGGHTIHRMGENIFMAATMLAVVPLLVVYLVAQRYFTQSIDRTGLVE
jgi:multiple sugar transport system permease protein